MNLKLCALLLLLLIPRSIEDTAVERFAWQEDKRLDWEDFKGTPPEGSVFAAVTSSGIWQQYTLTQKGYLDKKKSVVKAYFYPTLSWYDPETATPSTLRHERTHFDITELHARQLRKRIAGYDFTTNAEAEIKRLYAITEQSRLSMQQAFDEETLHSLRKDAEDYWETKIAALLREYAAYK